MLVSTCRYTYMYTIIGASLSEPHINGTAFAQLYSWYVRQLRYIELVILTIIST